MSEALVSIIIPLYNSAPYIKKCISSCLKQSYTNTEVIIVDDGSTDEGVKKAKEAADGRKNVKILCQDNKGVSSARNLGIEKAKGAYICFVDADDYLEEQFVSTMVEHMQRHGADFCFSKYTYDERKSKTGLPKKISSADAEALLLGADIKVGCWNKMYKMDSIRNVRFRTDLFYGEGLYFINQVAHNSKSIIVCEDGLYHYSKVNPESATTSFDMQKMINGEESLLRIKDMVAKDGEKVNNTWSQHYCLFCANAIRGLSHQIDCKDNKGERKVWRKKIGKNLLPALRSRCRIKIKVKILLTYIFPSIYRIKGANE